MKYPFQPEVLDALPEELAELYRSLELKLLNEICSRLKISGELNEVTVQDIRALRSHGIDLGEIEKAIQRTVNISRRELDKLLDEVVERNRKYYSEVIDLAGMTQPETLVSIEDTWAIYEQTKQTFQNLTRSGDHIVASSHIYGGTYNYLAHTFPEYGVETTFVDPADLKGLEEAVRDNTKAIFIETLGNPNSDIADIESIADIAHRHQIPLVIDNTFATPYLVRPIEYGADIVVHSATKFIGGHGTTVGGVIVDGGRFDWTASGKFPGLTEPNASYHGIRFAQDVGAAAFVTRIRAILLRDTGATLSPFHGFMFLQGLETLSLRVERHVENALEVVDYLKSHPLVEAVHHPSVSRDPGQQALYRKYFPHGGGSIFTFEIKGGAEQARNFIDNLELFSLLANVADVKSLVIHPASTTHSQLNEAELLEQGIRPGTIRLSIGTEHIDDILEDLEEAFKAIE